MSPSAAQSDVVRRCEEMARPLYAGLDGVQTFDRVDRVRARIEILAQGVGELDREALEILAVLHGVVARLGPLGPGGRLDLFLAGLGIDEGRRLRIRRGLDRFDNAPRRPEERLLHDAVLLEEAGVAAAVGRLMAAGKKRTPPPRAVDSLDPGPAEERFATSAGREWGRRQRLATARWLDELRGHFSGSSAAGAGRDGLRYHRDDE